MNPNLHQLHRYPFERLKELLAEVSPAEHLKPISLSIGEPKHQPPAFVKQALVENIDRIAVYPATKGSDLLREAIANWLVKRFTLPAESIDAHSHVLPVNGTREALFAFTQAVIDPRSNPLVVTPNPFYQIYEGAALLAGAELNYLDCNADNNFIADLDSVSKQVWQRCQLLHLCSPGNPTGAVTSLQQYQQAIALADKYDFIIASDECYSEVYLQEDNPPPGLLQACAELGRHNYSRCVVFHSLSKRSNLPGLRSGFVAGDQTLLKDFLRYRTYHGCAMSTVVQLASAAAWSDETHVVENRSLYREKFAAVTEILAPVLNFPQPEASFYLWPKTPVADTEFTRQLYSQQNITLLPGQFMSRQTDNGNPGANRVRLALVAEWDECIEAARRIRQFVESLGS